MVFTPELFSHTQGCHLPFQFAIPGPISVWNGKWSDPRQGPGMGLERQCFENLPFRARPAPFSFAIPVCHSRTHSGPVPLHLPFPFAIPGPISVWNGKRSELRQGAGMGLERQCFEYLPFPIPSGAFLVCHSRLPFPDPFRTRSTPFAIPVCHSRTSFRLEWQTE